MCVFFLKNLILSKKSINKRRNRFKNQSQCLTGVSNSGRGGGERGKREGRESYKFKFKSNFLR